MCIFDAIAALVIFLRIRKVAKEKRMTDYALDKAYEVKVNAEGLF